VTVWIDRDRAFVARRYDHLARLITLFEWLLFVPGKFREQAVATLELNPGDRVLEIGWGTGRNLPALRAAVGDTGHVYGIDLSAGMLSRARSLLDRHQWRNVTLVHGDAVDYQAPEPLDGVLFGFSYSTMPHHHAVLLQALVQLRPGGRVCVMAAGPMGQNDFALERLVDEAHAPRQPLHSSVGACGASNRRLSNKAFSVFRVLRLPRDQAHRHSTIERARRSIRPVGGCGVGREKPGRLNGSLC
jgi:ubiquinone/menaquinone biosynthesis C-methylase UbiE